MLSNYSMLDDDLYKLTMAQAVINKFPNALAKYEFINRGGTKFSPRFFDRFMQETADMGMLAIRPSDIMYLLDKAPYLSPPFLDWLDNYQYCVSELSPRLDSEGNFSLSIEGPWYTTILWEVKLMALISELYFETTKYDSCLSNFEYKFNNPALYKEQIIAEITDRALYKAQLIRSNGLTVIDFGTRRRFSNKVHKLVLETMGDSLAGTSNMEMSKEFGIPVVGTTAHEWIMAHGAVYGYSKANSRAMSNWRAVYGNALSVALTDTYTSDVFFRDTEGYTFDALRQDSGNPIVFVNKALEYYRAGGIDPLSKRIVFSDSLDIWKAIEIAEYCRGKIGCSFGIGTNLTNDVPGYKPLNMVIKMTGFSQDGKKWVPTVKLSDTPTKNTGDCDEVERCKWELGI